MAHSYLPTFAAQPPQVGVPAFTVTLINLPDHSNDRKSVCLRHKDPTRRRDFTTLSEA
eukprot:m.215922 g.215922  ORF g.215922 m.215922 type:complete len:58 (-) comp25632_c0_seq1:1514-1687(-)